MTKPISTAPRNGMEVEVSYAPSGREWTKASFERRANNAGGWRFADGGWLRQTDENDNWLWRRVGPSS